MYDAIIRADARFAETINSLKPGDEVEVEWHFLERTASARGLLHQTFDNLYLAHILVRNKQNAAFALASIRIIKRAEPEWAKAKVIAAGLFGHLYYRRDDGSYTNSLHGKRTYRDAADMATWGGEVRVVVDADGNWVWDEPELPDWEKALLSEGL